MPKTQWYIVDMERNIFLTLTGATALGPQWGWQPDIVLAETFEHRNHARDFVIWAGLDGAPNIVPVDYFIHLRPPRAPPALPVPTRDEIIQRALAEDAVRYKTRQRREFIVRTGAIKGTPGDAIA